MRRTTFAAVGAFALAHVALELALRGRGGLGADFTAPIYDACRDVLEGRNPYPGPGHDFTSVTAVVVLPLVLLAVVPLALLPEAAALAVWLTVLAAAAVATVRVLDLDRRHLLLWLTGAPVVTGFLNGNPILLVALALAVAWRWRDRPGIAGAGVAAAALLKLWPVALVAWLWLTGRRAASAVALAASAAAAIGGWAAIGFRGLRDYPAMLRDMSGDLADRGSWLIAWLANLGLAPAAAGVAGVLAALVLLGLAARRSRDGERFVLAAAAGITATATSWLHSLCVLVLPLSGRAWLLLPALWIPLDLGRLLGPGAQAAATLALVAAYAIPASTLGRTLPRRATHRPPTRT